MKTIKIGLVQMQCEKGALAQNLASIHASLQAGMGLGVEIMCFPEMSISGYVNPLRCPEAVLHLDGPEVARVLSMTQTLPITAIVGLIEGNPHGKPFITQIIAHAGKLLGVYRKQTIVEDEVHWFAPGSTAVVFQQAKVLFGVSICADIATPDIFTQQASLGAQIVFEAAAPGLYGSQATRDWLSGYQWWHHYCRGNTSRKNNR